jgi:predicted lipoprotein with Yx(FWY)xxD motif
MRRSWMGRWLAGLGAAALLAPAAGVWAAPRVPLHRAAASTVVRLAKVKVKGQVETVLVNGQGHTLYWLAGSTASKVVCTGKCAQIWPPLLAVGKLVTPKGLSGFSEAHTALGLQVLFRGHPLFLFIKDTKPGEALGQGIKGIWWVATPSLKPVTSAAPKKKDPSSSSNW